MKKPILLLAAAVLLMNNLASAQSADGVVKHKKKSSKMYARVGVGYAFTQAGEALEIQQTNSTVINVKKYSGGTGLNATLAGGYKLTNNFAAELGLNYTIVAQKGTDVEVYSNNNAETLTIKSKNLLYLVPAIVISTNTRPLDIYTRVGLVLPLLGKTNYEYNLPATATGSSSEMETEVYSYRFKVGFQGALGVKYPLAKKIGVFAEVSVISLNRWLKSSEVTKYELGGVDQLSTLSAGEKKTNYVYNYDYQSNQGVSSPSEEPTSSIPFSSVGVNLGIKIAL